MKIQMMDASWTQQGSNIILCFLLPLHFSMAGWKQNSEWKRRKRKKKRMMQSFAHWRSQWTMKTKTPSPTLSRSRHMILERQRSFWSEASFCMSRRKQMDTPGIMIWSWTWRKPTVSSIPGSSPSSEASLSSPSPWSSRTSSHTGTSASAMGSSSCLSSGGDSSRPHPPFYFGPHPHCHCHPLPHPH
jgi:hypothetical protein